MKKQQDNYQDSTRQALITAGLELFGEYGFKATSTRMLSQAAGANVSAIPYYFGNKEGLYKAVVEHIAQRVVSLNRPVFEEIQKVRSKGELTRSEAKKALKKFIESVAVMFVDSDEPKSWSLIIIREQVKPTDAFDIFYNGTLKNMHIMLTALFANCAGLEPESEEAKIRAHATIGQVLVFLASREAILRRLGVKKLTDRHVDLIHKMLWAHTEATLKVPSISGGTSS